MALMAECELARGSAVGGHLENEGEGDTLMSGESCGIVALLLD